MSYRRHTATSAANTNKKKICSASITKGLTNVASELKTPLYMSENALPPEDETISAIQSWLRIPAAEGPSQEAIASQSCLENEPFTDPTFPPDSSSLYADPSQPPASAPQLVAWRRISGQFYIPSPSGVQFAEGIQSCRWFLGALGAVATRPDLLLDLIVSDELATQGLYTFQFYKHGCWHQIVVDDHLPFCETEDGIHRPLFSASANRAELWPALIQKAYAKLHGGYSALSDGSISDALVDLTGGVCEKWRMEEPKMQEDAKSGVVWTRLAQFCAWGYVMVSYAKVESAAPKSEGRGGILLNHAYSVTACRELHDGTRLIRLHNPWVSGGWKGAWGPGTAEWDDPEYTAFKQEVGLPSMDTQSSFWMNYSDFLDVFNRICVNRLFPPFWHQLTLHCGWHGTAAGGPYTEGDRLSSTWVCNPQFRISCRKPCEILLALQQRDLQVFNGGHTQKADRSFSYGLMVLRVPSNHHWRLWEVRTRDVVHDSGLSCERDVRVSLKLTPDEPLVAVPYAFKAGQEGPFILRTFSSSPIEIEQLSAPLSLVVCGHWHGSSAGGSSLHRSWGSNPQYMVTVQHRTTAVISLSRPDIKHAIIPPKYSQEQAIGLVVTKPEVSEEGLVRRSCIRSSDEVLYETEYDSMEECVAVLVLEPEVPYLFVPSLFAPGQEAPFEMRVLSGVHVELTPLPERRTVTIAGEWTEALCGGCNLNRHWLSNPKFALSTIRKGKYRITLALSKGPWKRNQSLDGMIGFYIMKPMQEGQDKPTVLSETPFVPVHETHAEYELQSEYKYILMAATYSPGQQGAFTISVSSKEDFELTCYEG